MIRRRLQAVIEKRLRQSPAVVLLGPRQVGKTTLARAIAKLRRGGAIHIDLERPADRRRIEDADAFIRAQGRQLIIFDEVHRAPALFGVLRGIIDERRASGFRSGQFLLLGSASLDLMRQAAETLAGRVAYLDLGVIDILEQMAAKGSIDRLWIRGGFPDSLLAQNDIQSLQWRHDFIRSYLERDVPMFAPRLPAETVGRLWTMLAHLQGTILNHSQLASSLAVSTPTVGRYIDLLVDLFLVRRLRPWSGNGRKRLVRSPKVYIRDSGLVHALLDLASLNDIIGHPVSGASWEGFVIESLISAAGNGRTPYFYRTEDGAEVDLVFERGGVVEAAIEIKRSSAPSVSKGFGNACAEMRPAASFVVHAGTGEWPLPNGVLATTLPLLAARLASTAERGRLTGLRPQPSRRGKSSSQARP
jgi:predicted AAA+ superfamily ATPase